MSKILYFTSLALATAEESAAISRLRARNNVVEVRRGDTVADTKFGSGALETCDFVAGTLIPSAYSDAKTTVTAPPANNTDAFKVFPAVLSVNHAVPETSQLAAIAAAPDANSSLCAMTDLSADASVAWTSSDGSKATVGASTGKVTSVAAGSCTITARRTFTALDSVTGAAATDLLTKTAHGLNTGDSVYFTLGSGFTGLTTATTYYVIKVDANTFKLATSYANALAGTAIDITVDGTGATVSKSPQVSTCAVTVT